MKGTLKSKSSKRDAIVDGRKSIFITAYGFLVTRLFIVHTSDIRSVLSSGV